MKLILNYFQNPKERKDSLLAISSLIKFFFESEKNFEWEKFCNEDKAFYESMNPEINSKNSYNSIKVIYLCIKIYYFLIFKEEMNIINNFKCIPKIYQYFGEWNLKQIKNLLFARMDKIKIKIKNSLSKYIFDVLDSQDQLVMIYNYGK